MTVTIVVGKRHLLAGLSLLVMIALGLTTLIVPTVTGAATTYTRSASCGGVTFEPNGDVDFRDDGVARHSLDPNYRYFRCDPHLPNGAVVTKVQFSMLEDGGSDDATSCALVRMELAAGGDFLNDVIHMADVPVPWYGPSQPTIFRFSTTTITGATVNNAKYAYWLECSIDNDSNNIVGADVIYNISASNG